MYLEGSNFDFFKNVDFCLKMDPLGPMEARPTCYHQIDQIDHQIDHPINDHPINDHPILIEIEIEIEIDHPIDHLKMDPLGPMEARPTCFSTLFLNYFQDLENDPRCDFYESESIFSRNGLTASRFIEKMRKHAENDDDQGRENKSLSLSMLKISWRKPRKILAKTRRAHSVTCSIFMQMSAAKTRHQA